MSCTTPSWFAVYTLVRLGLAVVGAGYSLGLGRLGALWRAHGTRPPVDAARRRYDRALSLPVILAPDQRASWHRVASAPQLVVYRKSASSGNVDPMDIGPAELLIVLAVVLLLFGSKKLPELARGMGQASREFRKGLHLGAEDDDTEGTTASADPPEPTRDPHE